MKRELYKSIEEIEERAEFLRCSGQYNNFTIKMIEEMEKNHGNKRY